MNKPTPLAIKRQLRDAQRIHKAEQYPGNLAADLGLKPKTPWLKRGLVALTAAAALALTATVAMQLIGDRDSPTTSSSGSIAHVQPTPTPEAPITRPAIEVTPAIPQTPTKLSIAVAQRNLDHTQARILVMQTHAKKTASQALAQRWAGRASVPAPAAGLATAIGHVRMRLPTFPTPSLTLPRGLSLPTSLSLTRPRKALS